MLIEINNYSYMDFVKLALFCIINTFQFTTLVAICCFVICLFCSTMLTLYLVDNDIMSYWSSGFIQSVTSIAYYLYVYYCMFHHIDMQVIVLLLLNVALHTIASSASRCVVSAYNHNILKL